ncbi:MAG: hypothetical protein C0597_04765 [Marinilabiliales bacterium]|nr:MAG: hypothetical protein C0597_04765 [Marinilabiliales bacterium]
MKRIITVIIILIFTTPALIAQDSLKDVVRDYQNKNSEFTLVIPSFLIKVGLAFGDMEVEDRAVLEMIDYMKIVISEKHFHKTDFTMLEEGIKNGNFVEVMTVNDGADKVRMIMNQKSKRRSEMLMLVESDDESILMLYNFHGEPDFSKFLSLTN